MSYYYQENSGGFLSRIPKVTKNLILVNVVVYVATLINQNFMVGTFGLFYPTSPYYHWWQVVTHMFMHGGFLHILFNMYTLFIFGVVVERTKEAVGERMTAVAEMAGAKISLTGAYPGWKPNMESPILKTMMATYKKLFGKEPEIKAIHAGLECGLLGGVYPNWDMISFGPTIMHPHSPDEKVNIESVDRFWKFLVETLANIPVK